MQKRNSKEIIEEIIQKFGFLPSFFEPALITPSLFENLWQQTLHLYLENPVPPLLKEKVAALLSRFCPVAHCLIGHSIALKSLGMSGVEIFTMLQQPALSRKELLEKTACLIPSAVKCWPDPNSVLEEAILCCCVAILLDHESAYAHAKLRDFLSEIDYNWLLSLISWKRTFLSWAEAHPEISFHTDPQTQKQVNSLIEEEPRLHEFFNNYLGQRAKLKKQHSEKEALELEHARLKNIFFAESLVAKALLRGPFHIFDMVNENYIKLTGHTDLIGKRIIDVFPELAEQKFPALLTQVYETGTSFLGSEVKVLLKTSSLEEPQVHYQDILYRRIDDGNGNPYGVMIQLNDVTEQVVSRKQREQNAKQLSLAIQAAELGFWDYDISTDVLSWSEQFGKQWNLPPTTSEGKLTELLSRIHPQDQSSIIEAITTSSKTGNDYHTEYRIFTESGEWKWIEAKGRTKVNAQGEVFQLYGTTLDITDRKRSEETIRQSEKQFRLLADSMPQVVWTAKPDGVLDYTNLRWIEYSGSESPKDWLLYVHPDDQERAIQAWTESLTSSRIYETEFRLKRLSDQSYRWHLVRAIPSRDPFGKIERWFGTCTDIEDQKISAQALQAAQHLAEAERQKLNDIFAEAPAAMVIFKGPQHIFEKANPYYENLILKQDYIGKPLLEVQPELKDQPFPKLLDDVFQTGISYMGKEMLAYMQRQPGVPPEARYFDFIYGQMKDEQSKPYGVFIHSVDVTDKVMARQQIKEREEKLSQAVQAAQLGFWEYQASNQQVTWSEELRKQYDFPENQYSSSVEEIFAKIHPEDQNRVFYALNSLHTQGNRYQIEFRVFNESDSIRWLECQGECFFDEKEKLTRMIGTTLDITNRVVVAEQLTMAKELAEAANAAKSSFLANMSHEIRTPLGAIMGFVDLMKQPNLSRNEMDEYLSIINRNSGQLLRIIDDILDLSKVEAGKMVMEYLDFSVSEFLADFASLMGFRARENGISFELEAHTALPNILNSDPTRLRQILTNVVGNAIKFTERGSVTLSVSYQEPLLEFVVTDTGRGISQEQAQKLFQPFTQADASTTRKFGGTGLGLHLTKRLCEAMGGSFELRHSALGKGSTFAAKVRVKLPKRAQIIPSSELTFTTRSATVENNTEKLAGLHILLVEDSPDNQALIKILLQKAGARVDIASDGLEGVEKALSYPYNIILMDVQMPKMDGYEAIKILRAKGYEGSVIALTAHAMKEERERCIQFGFSEFLTKPIQKAELLETIQNLSQSSSGKNTNRTKPELQQTHSRSILVVEDDTDIRMLLTKVLEGIKFQVKAAADGRDALSYLQQGFTPGLILLDLTLPDIHGSEFMEKLRQNPKWIDVPVVITSGWDNLESHASRLQAHGFFRKPFDFHKLKTEILRFFEEKS